MNTTMCRSTAEPIHPKIRKKVVGFLTDKFYIVALCLGTGTKMHHKKRSPSFCTLDDQGHFCTSVGGVGRELPISDAAQLFSVFHAVLGDSPASSRMDIGDHVSALAIPCHLYVAVKYSIYLALSLRMSNGLMSRSYT